MKKEMRSAKWYGWKPDLPDHRDKIYSVARVSHPTKVDLRPKLPVSWDQGNLGSCTGHGVGGAIVFLRWGFMPSRLMLYYGGRELEGTVKSDDGAQIRDVVKAAHKIGAAPEADWKYVISNFAKKPPKIAYKDAAQDLLKTYHRVPIDLNSIKSCLVEGFPYVFGFTVPESFESDAVAKTGILPMPSPHEKMLGGHCVLGVGYDDARSAIIVRNSWGTSWGDHGHFYMPYDFASNSKFCDDAWTLRA